MPFDGMRVLSLESRRAAEMETLIRKQGGDAFVAPSMREAPIEEDESVFTACGPLLAGEIDMMICLTGVGMRALDKLLATRYPPERLREILRDIRIVARGPKPSSALREMDVPIEKIAPEPNTWREVMGVLEDPLPLRVAVQEYGRTNPDLLAALQARGATVTPITIYRWRLPEDTGPLRKAARELAQGAFDVVIFTTPNQVINLLQIAGEEGVAEALPAGLASTVVASVGPSTTEMLLSKGIAVDIEPSRPKMGFLVRETAAGAADAARRKRGGQ
jgi:uroporphyrinogen-III synthase